MKPPLHTVCMWLLLCVLCKVQPPELNIKWVVWALKPTAPDSEHPLHQCPLCHSCTAPWAPGSRQLSAQVGPRTLHARCQALSICQLESHSESGFSPFQLLCKEGQERPCHLSSHVPGSVSHSQLLHSLIHRGRGLELHRPVLSLRP